MRQNCAQLIICNILQVALGIKISVKDQQMTKIRNQKLTKTTLTANLTFA